MKTNKENFVELIKIIQEFLKQRKVFEDAINTVAEPIIKTFIDINENNEYFLWDWLFGDTSILDYQDKEVNLNTPEKLYDYLEEEGGNLYVK